MKKKIKTKHASSAIGPYSQAILVENIVFTSGQIHITPQDIFLEGTVGEQTLQIMNNLKAVLKAAGASFGDVVKTTVYITEMSMFNEMNEVYRDYFEEPYPARETVGVKELPKGAKIEISMIAYKSK